MKKIAGAIVLIALAVFLILLILASLIKLKKEPEEAALKNFYKLTREDPLFYSPFFNAAETEESLQKFKLIEEQIKNITILQMQTGGYPEDLTAQISVTQKMKLMPYEFLHYLISINKKTEEFFQSPSPKNAEELLLLYEEAAECYINDASQHLETVETLEKLTEKALFIFYIDSITSSQIIKEDLLTIEENGYALKEEIRKRKKCLYGEINCSRLKKNKDNTRFLELLEESRIFNLKGEKIEFIKNQIPDIFENRGPYRIDSTCWPRAGDHPWLYYRFIEKDSQAVIVPPKLATQNYYYKKPIGEQGTNDTFLIYGEGTFYQCKDLTYYPQIITLDFIQEKIKEGFLTQKELETSLNYKLFIENQFSLLDQLIKEAIIEMRFKAVEQLQDIGRVSPAQLFLTNFHYSIFYFPFAESIWRINKKLNYSVPKTQNQLLKQSINSKTLDELMGLGYSLEEIQHFHIYVWNFYPLLWEDTFRFY